MALSGRPRRRLLGALSARLPELRLDLLPDPRKPRGKRWSLSSLLTASLLALLSGKKSLRETEELTEDLPLPIRRKFGIRRRVPDTTLRDTLVRLSPLALRRLLHRQTRAAHRRKALVPQGLPFGVLALDGKATSLPCWDEHYAQRRNEPGCAPRGMVTTLTACLVSARGQPCVDILPVPAQTSETGHFRAALAELVATYGQSGLFRLLSYDSGACYEHNGRAVREADLHYLFVLKENQPTLWGEARRLLGGQPPSQALFSTEDLREGKVQVRRLYLTEELAGYLDWTHLQTVLRVQTEVQDKSGRVLGQEDRYFLCSLPSRRLSAKQWLLVIRRHWGVENGCHWTLDGILREDEHPWIEEDSQGMVVVAVLRRVVYNLLTLYRSVTQRGEEQRLSPWKRLVNWYYQALLFGAEEDLLGLRRRRAVALN